MNKKEKSILKKIVFSLIMLLLVRLVFFLQDDTSDIIESILRWTIFVGSVSIISIYIKFNIKSIKEFFMKYQDKFILVGLIFWIDIAFKIKNSLELTPVYLFALLLILILIATFSLLLPKKASKIFDISLMILYVVYAFSQDLYYKIFRDFFSLREIVNAQEGVESAEGTYYFSVLHIIMLILAVLTITKYIKLKRTSHFSFTKSNLRMLYKAPLFLFILVNINAQYPINFARLHLSDHYLYSSMYDKEQFVTKFSTVNLLFRDLKVIITPSFSINRDIEYIEDYYDNNVKLHPDNEYTDIFEGKNLIFIIGESFDSIAVSEELTPNIYKLKTEGLDFVNHFTPVFPRTTCDSEIIFNTSIIPSITDGPTCYVYNENSYSESIAELFNNSGYITTGLHNNYKEFYTRDLVYEGFGYDYFYGQNEIPLTDTEIRYDSVFGEKTLDYAIYEDELFFSTYLSLSGHSPYEETNLATVEHLDIVNDYYGDTYSDTIKGYIASQIEVDLMIGVIMEDLEAKGILDDTVIVFTNDHYPYALDQEEYENVKGIEEDYEKMRGVLYIWSSDIEHAEVDKLSSSFDFLPTMINMFGLDGNYSSYIGNDIFCEELDPIVYFKDYSIYDGINHYSFSETSDIINTSVIAIAQANYDLSQKLLSVNYYKKE